MKISTAILRYFEIIVLSSLLQPDIMHNNPVLLNIKRGIVRALGLLMLN